MPQSWGLKHRVLNFRTVRILMRNLFTLQKFYWGCVSICHIISNCGYIGILLKNISKFNEKETPLEQKCSKWGRGWKEKKNDNQPNLPKTTLLPYWNESLKTKRSINEKFNLVEWFMS